MASLGQCTHHSFCSTTLGSQDSIRNCFGPCGHCAFHPTLSFSTCSRKAARPCLRVPWTVRPNTHHIFQIPKPRRPNPLHGGEAEEEATGGCSPVDPMTLARASIASMAICFILSKSSSVSKIKMPSRTAENVSG